MQGQYDPCLNRLDEAGRVIEKVQGMNVYNFRIKAYSTPLGVDLLKALNLFGNNWEAHVTLAAIFILNNTESVFFETPVDSLMRLLPLVLSASRALADKAENDFDMGERIGRSQFLLVAAGVCLGLSSRACFPPETSPILSFPYWLWGNTCWQGCRHLPTINSGHTE